MVRDVLGALVMPRDALLLDSKCHFFQTLAKHIFLPKILIFSLVKIQQNLALVTRTGAQIGCGTQCRQTKCRPDSLSTGKIVEFLFFVGGSTPLTGYFPTQDMQAAPPLPLSFAPVFMKDAQCAESNEKSIFRFLFMSYRKNSSRIGVF